MDVQILCLLSDKSILQNSNLQTIVPDLRKDLDNEHSSEENKAVATTV